MRISLLLEVVVETKVPVNPDNPLDKDKNGYLDGTDLKAIVKESVPVIVAWIMWFFFNRKK